MDLLFKSKIKLEFRFTTCVIKRLGTEMEGFVFIEESKVKGWIDGNLFTYLSVVRQGRLISDGFRIVHHRSSMKSVIRTII